MSEPVQKQARMPGWRFILGTSGAGVLSFAAAAFLTLVLREASSVSAPPATAVAAARPGAFPRGTAAGASLSALPPVTPAAGPMPIPIERLRGGVTHNPFAALNNGVPLPAFAASTPAAKPAPVAKAAVAPVVSPAPPPAPPTPPTAPPLPFVAVGAIEGAQVTGGQPVAFIRQQEQLLVVRAGDAIGQTYKVVSISPTAIEFTYLPLMQRQSLALAP